MCSGSVDEGKNSSTELVFCNFGKSAGFDSSSLGIRHQQLNGLHYTHYWVSERNLPSLDSVVLEAINSVFRQFQEIICFECDEPNRLPEADPNLIIFNGKEDDGHETFFFHVSNFGFQFCKTAWKPYDTPVVAILVILKSYYGNLLNLSSDGTEDDWEEGISVARALGYEWEGFKRTPTPSSTS